MRVAVSAGMALTSEQYASPPIRKPNDTMLP